MSPQVASMGLAHKLHPSRFTAMSPKMAAIVGCILGESWTTPELYAVRRTVDGYVLGMHAGDVGFNVFIGSYSDLVRNWARLLLAAELTAVEMKEADRLFGLALQRGEAL